ncbi:MAG: fibrobacter succinogenes major paralogous domain-containing protein [Bacteroidales bacterium]|nr:fibrobacter succinogenes major paralogous domain-containing protein [Bacteroidales bacterium]
MSRKSITQKRDGRRYRSIPFFYLFLIVLWAPISVKAQTCQIELLATATPAHCQGDGIIHCTLADTSGLQLEQIRYSYIPFIGEDSVVNTELAVMGNLRPGHYRVIVSALCATGLSQGEAYTIVSDTVTDVLVDSLYSIPSAGIPYHIFSFLEPYGIVPSYDCAPSGRAQIRIESGSYPYTVEIWRISGSDTVHLRDDHFNSQQHNGNNPLDENFKHYYDLDSLAPGDYWIQCYDGCGYHVPDMSVTIPTLSPDYSAIRPLLRNSSGIPTSDNIITMKLLFRMLTTTTGNDDYYRYQSSRESMYEYRFINPAICSQDTTLWRPAPLLSSNGAAMLRDTVSAFDNYGDIWFHDVTLQLRSKYCEDSILSYSFTIYPQGNNKYRDIITYTNRHNAQTYYDCLGYHNSGSSYDQICMSLQSYHSITGSLNSNSDSININHYNAYTSEGYINSNWGGMVFQSYITLPLIVKVTDISRDSLVRVDTLTQLQYEWIFKTPIDTSLSGDTLVVEIFDNNLSPIFSYSKQYIYDLGHHVSAGFNINFRWDTIPVRDDRFCDGTERTIGIYHNGAKITQYQDSLNRPFYSYEEDTIRMVESPGNLYNFAVVLHNPDSIEVLQTDSLGILSFNVGVYLNQYSARLPSFEVSGTNLPNGDYKWVITHSCDESEEMLISHIRFPNEPEITEAPQFEFVPACTRLNIIPTAGKFSYKNVELETYFTIRQGDTLEHSANSRHVGDTLSVGVPGTYTLSMYALPKNNETLLSLNPCFVWDTIIVWDGNTIELDYLYAYVCHAEDSIGMVRTRGRNGLRPYEYTLFSASNGSGDTLAQNELGDFFDMPIHLGQILSVNMEDACGAHFITDITVTNLESQRKGWLENGEAYDYYELGDTCHLHAISLGDISYHWTGPDNFSSTSKDTILIIDDEQRAGSYYLTIEGSGCDPVNDSIRVLLMEDMPVPCPSATDFDGNVYESTRINGLCWTRTNLRSEHYGDGREIPHIYHYNSYMYPDSIANSDIFGFLYNWPDAMDLGNDMPTAEDSLRQGICPEGWRLPTGSEMSALAVWGDALRSPLYWWDGGGSDETLFSALPAGFFNHLRNRYENLYYETRFWSSNYNFETGNVTILDFITNCNEGKILQKPILDAYSIRCVLIE